MINSIALGNLGAELITDTAVHNNSDFIGFLVIEAAVINTFKGQISGNSISTVSFPAGVYVPLNFESISLTSGKILCIKAGGLN
jgi:hypothetical protein